ncbi:hypothetical protein [Ornithinimicrobium cavernae]|uniref:hypothetical protein n=1 Tax=Ornithinimicrobium cavernae TaxID=2666047 RepID=UPI0012B16B86|nr:hypothetical protein [Ornithinimicrobium cavernae]
MARHGQVRVYTLYPSVTGYVADRGLAASNAEYAVAAATPGQAAQFASDDRWADARSPKGILGIRYGGSFALPCGCRQAEVPDPEAVAAHLRVCDASPPAAEADPAPAPTRRARRPPRVRGASWLPGSSCPAGAHTLTSDLIYRMKSGRRQCRACRAARASAARQASL